MNFNDFSEIDYFSDINNINTNNYQNETNSIENKLFNPYEGYLRGNLFKNLYDGYKNYKPRIINVSNEKEEMLLNIGQLSFARHELNLLLDNYPNNLNILNLFNNYLKMEKTQTENYERKYGPLTISSDYMTKTPFSWVSDKWPWEV